MSLDVLAADAFKRGVGISLAHARRSPRLRELEQRALELGLIDPADSALVMYLGERLADRAYRNLPYGIRSQIGRWHEGVEAQHELLELLYQNIHSASWQRRGRQPRPFEYNSDVACTLPHAAGSWGRGSIAPNCLGAAQMLVGFARAVGARHYLVNVVRTFEQEIMGWQALMLTDTFRILKHFPSRSRAMHAAVAKLHRCYRQVLLGAAQMPRNQAHHALLIQLADGSWWLLDSYLRAYYRLSVGVELEAALNTLERYPNQVAIISPSVNQGCYNRLAVLVRSFMYICALTRSYDEAGSREPILSELAKVVAYARLPDSENAKEEHFLDVSLSDPLAQGELFADLYACTVFTGVVGDGNPRFFQRNLRRACGDPVLHQRYAWRMVAAYLDWLPKQLDELFYDPRARQHRCLEIASPSMMLGAATLNHLWAANSVPLGGQLGALISGQWLLANTLAAEQEGDAIGDAYQSEVMGRLRLLRTLAVRQLVPPLQHLVVS